MSRDADVASRLITQGQEEVDWAQVAMELVVDWAGGENTSDMLVAYGLGPFANGCRDCGVAWVGDQPCWYCHPQPPPRLIVPGCPDRALP